MEFFAMAVLLQALAKPSSTTSRKTRCMCVCALGLIFHFSAQALAARRGEGELNALDHVEGTESALGPATSTSQALKTGYTINVVGGELIKLDDAKTHDEPPPLFDIIIGNFDEQQNLIQAFVSPKYSNDPWAFYYNDVTGFQVGGGKFGTTGPLLLKSEDSNGYQKTFRDGELAGIVYLQHCCNPDVGRCQKQTDDALQGIQQNLARIAQCQTVEDVDEMLSELRKDPM
eukprot:TRINITY_DN56491_c0_g1_i1.p1 TRINITY_DN56491_c0_g1~~TRINITY_DN56491_c0_g1_i1.p1  ORF type:complete len:230 (+),score=24.63 TRINITY_DN56491_c0_g1_i1:84-773(+)